MPEKRKEIKVSGKQLVDTYKSDQAKMDMLQRREQSLQQMLGELLIAREAIKEIQKTKKDENILVSIGAGIYANAQITGIKSVKSSVGGNVLVETEASKVLSKLQNEIKRAQKDLTSLQNEKQKTGQNMQNIAGILQQGQRAAQKEKKGSEGQDVSSVT